MSNHVIDVMLKMKDSLTPVMKNVEKTLTDFDRKFNDFGKAAGETGRKFNRVGKHFTNVGESMKKAAVPIAGAMIYSVKEMMNFEDGMGKVATIADTSQVPLSQLRKGVLDLSMEFGVGARDVAEGLYQTMSASVPTGESLEFLGKATKAAKAGFTDTATAVDAATSVINTYGMDTKEADKIFNQFLITQNRGKTTFDEIGKSIGQVVPLASQLGIKSEEVLSSVASTTAQGLNTSESMTALKAAMSNIVKPSKQAAEVTEALGIDFSTAAVKSKGWIGFLKDVKEGLSKASPEFANLQVQSEQNANKLVALEKAGKKGTKEYKELKKANKGLVKSMEQVGKAAGSPVDGMAQVFGSVQGLNAMLMLTSDQGMGIYNKTLEEMGTNVNAVNDAYAKISDTPGEKFKKAMNGMKIAAIEFGAALSPVLSRVTNDIQWFANKLKSMSPEQKKFVTDIGMLIIKLTIFNLTIGKVLTKIGKLGKGIKSLRDTVKNFGGILKLVSSPVGQVVAVLILLGITIALIIKHWDKLKKAIKKAGDKLSEFTGIGKKEIDKLKEIFGRLADTIKDKFKEPVQHFQHAMDNVKESLNKLKPIIDFTMKIFGKLGVLVGIKLVAQFTMAFSLISNVVSTIVDVVAGVFDGCSDIFTGFLDYLIGSFTGDWEQTWDGLVKIVEGAKTLITSLWQGLIDFLTTPVQALVDVADAMFKEKVARIKELWEGLRAWIENPISGTVNLIKHGNVKGKDGSHAVGGKIPFDHYTAELHEGERVLTKQQSMELDRKGHNINGGGITINIDKMEVRNEGDIDKIANALYQKFLNNANNLNPVV